MTQERFRDYTGRNSEGQYGRAADDDQEYNELSGPGGASGIGDDPFLAGSTGDLDDVGMHMEEGFSVGYDNDDDIDIDGDMGNRIEGSYTTLADAAQGELYTEDDSVTRGSQNALGIDSGEDDLSLDKVTGGGLMGNGAIDFDADSDMEQAS